MTNTPAPAVDYTGLQLSVGQDVAFIGDPDNRTAGPRLYTGKIKLIGEEQLVVASGPRFFTMEGQTTGKVVTYWTIMGR